MEQKTSGLTAPSWAPEWGWGVGRGSNTHLRWLALGQPPAAPREERLEWGLGATATTLDPSWAPYLGASDPKRRVLLSPRGHPTPPLWPHRLQEGRRLYPRPRCARERLGDLPRSRPCTPSTATLPATVSVGSLRPRTTTTIASIHRPYPRLGSRASILFSGSPCLDGHTPTPPRTPRTSRSPSILCRVATGAWATWASWAPASLPPFLLTPHSPLIRSLRSSTRSPHTRPEGAPSASHLSRCRTRSRTRTHTPIPPTCTRRTRAPTPCTSLTSSSPALLLRPSLLPLSRLQSPRPALSTTRRRPPSICPSILRCPPSPLPPSTPLYPPLPPPLSLLCLSPLSPPAPRPPFTARGAARALAGSDWSRTWGTGTVERAKSKPTNRISTVVWAGGSREAGGRWRVLWWLEGGLPRGWRRRVEAGPKAITTPVGKRNAAC